MWSGSGQLNLRERATTFDWRAREGPFRQALLAQQSRKRKYRPDGRT